MVKVELKGKKLEYSAAEAYKSLRTNLQFCGEDKKVIAITSCAPDEGKSSVSLNLAQTLAEFGKKVLLIDADLRKAGLTGNVRSREVMRGMTHFLTQSLSITDVICTTNIDNLHIIVSGPTPPNPTELLGSKRFQETIGLLRKIYDYILIDTPPLGYVIDSAVVAGTCDGIVLVVESGAISYRYVRNVKLQIEKSGCPILGVVLNKVDLSKRKYYGKYYGKFYEEYGK